MKYEQRGVSAGKQDVHEAIKNLDKGLYPNAFCKVLPDLAAGNEDYANILHADTAGTKAALAYLYWKETGDLTVWEGIVQDAVVMNLDDIACTGLPDSVIFSNTINRNKSLIPGEVIKTLIEGSEKLMEKLRKEGVNVTLAGGETADVGDLVRSVDVGFTAFARMHRNNVLENNIQPGNIVIGLSSAGQASYEDQPNSGIGSNGLTFARHELLNHEYEEKYPETFDPALDPSVVYTGSYDVTDKSEGSIQNVGKMLLSPTRTYAPFLKKLFEANIPLNGIIHCTGGGLTKVLHFIDNCHIIKDNPLPVPDVFKLIQKENNTPWKEMYQVFNMGQRLEIYLPPEYEEHIIKLAGEFNIEAQKTGYCIASENPQVTVTTPDGEAIYQK